MAELHVAGRVSPRRARHFSCRPRKVPKRRPPCCLRPCGFAFGQPGSQHLRGVPHNSLRAPRFVHTDAASQITKRWHSAVPAPPCKHHATGACKRGQPDSQTSTRAIAALGSHPFCLRRGAQGAFLWVLSCCEIRKCLTRRGESRPTATCKIKSSPSSKQPTWISHKT